MRTAHGLIAASILALTAAQGCRSDFDREALSASLRIEQGRLDGAGVQKALALKPEARRPVKIAVVFPQDAWTREQKAPILSALERLKAADGVSEVAAVSDSMVPAGDADSLKKARYAAAKYQADVLLLVRDANQKNQYVNALSILDLTIVGAFIFPASHCDALAMLECSFWDVRNECLLGTVEAEGQASAVRPSFLISAKKVLQEARMAAAKDAATALGSRAPLILKSLPEGTPGEPKAPLQAPEPPNAPEGSAKPETKA